jgi:Cof subfamily protein (haloacid dehalogenase superfamily)
VKLFATDLDGTLLMPGDAIHPRDVAALRAARERGVLVTIATGRLTSRTHPIARRLGFELPLLCADGCVVACGATERILKLSALPSTILARSLELMAELELASFVFTADSIHSCLRGAPYHAYMQGWAETITAHDDVRTGADQNAAVILLGIGDAETVLRAVNALAAHAPIIDVTTFESAGQHVLRISPMGTSKGAALAALATELGVAREHVAVAGDFWNDLSMFAYAGRSFAMPHAPEAVRRAATHPLDHDVAQHGAFADALEAWLDET